MTISQINIASEARKRASHKDLQKLASVREYHLVRSSCNTNIITQLKRAESKLTQVSIWWTDSSSRSVYLKPSKLSETMLKTGDSLARGFQKVLLESFHALKILNLKPAERRA